MKTPPDIDNSHSLVPVPDSLLADAVVGANRIVSAMVGEMLSTARIENGAAILSQQYDAVFPNDILPRITALAQKLVEEGVKTPQALANNLRALGPKYVSISQRLWQIIHGFIPFADLTPEVTISPDWAEVYAGLDKEKVDDLATKARP